MTRTSMKKFIGSIKRSSVAQSRSKESRNNGVLDQPQVPPQGDHPEAVVVREVMAFCEAGAPGSNSAGDEYLHLPAIVDAAESSPHASREAALCLQRYLSKQNFERGYAQYNAIMLMRILTDNPGPVFTQYFDKSFISTFKTLLKEGRDTSVQQIARETLDYIEAEKLNGNDTVMPLVEMWRKEKSGSARMYSSGGHSYGGPAPYLPPRNQGSPRGLPPPEELSARIEESRTSARLLVQMIQSTPQEELIGNELIKEFAERARQAHKSIQFFMACENPSPDENTMLTLIETSEQLGIAMNKHQRSVLQARKVVGVSSASTTPQPQANSQDPFSTTAMHNALPSSHSQPQPQPQSQRNTYDPYPAAAANNFLPPPQMPTRAPAQPKRPQAEREESDLYGPSQPQQSYSQYKSYNQNEEQDLYGDSGRVSPIDQREQSYLPPIGPPPPRTQQPQTYQPQLSRPSHPQQSIYSAPPVNRGSPTATRDYNVSENPFADDNAYSSSTRPAAPPPPQQQQQQQQYQPYSAPSHPPPQQNNNPHSLFNRAAGQLRDPQSPTQTSVSAPSELDSSDYPPPPPPSQSKRESQSRPGPRGYHEDWQPTPSFVQRQDSSTAHFTMSGASPPPASRF